MSRPRPLLVTAPATRRGRRAFAAGLLLAALSACTPAPRSPSVNQPPLPVLALPESARVGESVLVDGDGSQDPGGAVSDAHLLFGDGSDPAAGLSAEHTWEAPGLYLVELYIIDDAGAPARARARIQIIP